ncbi:Formin-like protein 8, partial [Cucurbita argyrosperma subsp. sororia]
MPLLLLLQLWQLHLFLFFLSVSSVCYCQLTPPQNIQTFYPSPFIPQPPSPLSSLVQPTPSSSLKHRLPSSTLTRTITTAVAVTAVSTALISTLFFFLIQRYLIRRKRNVEVANSGPVPGPILQPAVAQSESSCPDGNLKGYIVDENGLDVIYWKRLERRNSSNSFDWSDRQENVMKNRSKKTKPVQEVPLLRGNASPEEEEPSWITSPSPPQINHPPPFTGNSVQAVGKPSSSSIHSSIEHSQSLRAVPYDKSSVPTSPPPVPAKTNTRPPPPPPPIPVKTNSRLPPLPPIQVQTNAAPPPPQPPNAGASKGGNSSGEASSVENGQVKFIPLHWDKVNTANTDHSMVWDKMNGGSFKFDGDLMEALFGYVATDRKSPRNEASSSGNAFGRNSGPSQTFILEQKKSQNIAIIIKSLTIPRNEILDALNEGQGLETDNLEKLTRIALTQKEISQILEYEEDPQKLADAESFLYHLLTSVPTAFTRFNAMLFRLNFSSEILHLKKSLRTLESACKELRSRGLFLKLLEAILKAGNRLNAGTARGNARAFNLTALRKLSDVQSTDGKTTLLHFVVKEVIRTEGKKCVLNRNKSMSRNNSSNSSENSFSSREKSTSKEDAVKEYMMLGLPVVGGLSAELSNVRKAAAIDYESVAKAASSLTSPTLEIRQLLIQIGNNGGGFTKEMRGFLEAAEDELKVAREEQTRVMELVMKTTEYYQAQSSKDNEANRLQLFIIVKDFLEMVDRVCIEIARELQRRSSAVDVGSSQVRSKTVFPSLPENFMSDKSKGSSSDSDEEF